MKLRSSIILGILGASLIAVTASAQAPSSEFKTIETSLSYTSDLFANASGGLNRGMRYLDNIDLEISGELNQVTVYLRGLGNQGQSISELAGDIQAVSNIESDNSWRLYEAWANIVLPENLNSSFLIGLYDLNSEFDVMNTSGLFINSSHGIGADFSSTGEMGPSIFPFTSLAARFKVVPIPGLIIKAAVLDAVPSNPLSATDTPVMLRQSEGVLYASEISFSPGSSTVEEQLSRGVSELTRFRIVVGGWNYSNLRTGWSGDLESDRGIYASVESVLFKEQPGSDEGLVAFFRVGSANQRINRFSHYLGGGFSYTGLIKSRNEDVMGIAFSMPLNGDDFIESEQLLGNDFTQNELTTEFTYLMILNDRVSLQLDTQYVIHPNQAPNIKNALVTGVRSTFSF